jgi:hypothetical protein
MQINQVRFSKSVKFFEKGFCEKWDMKPYHDVNAPCFFVGIYRSEDVSVINSHKGFKVVWNSGRPREIFSYVNKDAIVMVGNGIKFSLPGYKVKEVNIEIKDYSMFQPSPMGNKIYCYLGNEKGKDIMGYDFIEELKGRVEHEIIIGMQGHGMDWVKENYYDKCFVNIKPNITGGITTATELAYMGRYTVSNTDLPYCIGYKSIDDVAEIIKEQSKKIGTTQKPIIGDFF